MPTPSASSRRIILELTGCDQGAQGRPACSGLPRSQCCGRDRGLPGRSVLFTTGHALVDASFLSRGHALDPCRDPTLAGLQATVDHRLTRQRPFPSKAYR